MFLFNLSFFEFMGLLTAVSAVVVALYLLSRSRKRVTVSTLHFWQQATQPVPSSRRRRIQQPWSLVLQLLSLALLLLAIAQLKWGDRERATRDHVILLDASSWMGARSGQRTLLDEAKAKARAFVRALPGSDRVMVVRVDALASPATGMEWDRAVIERAIEETRPGASALNLEHAFAFAGHVRKLHGGRAGEIVYVGARRVSGKPGPWETIPNLRVLAVEAATENAGIAKIGVRRSASDVEVWNVFLAIRNYGRVARRVPVVVQFGGAPAGTAVLEVAPGATENRTFNLRTRAAGWMEARLLVRDALEEDNRAILELPALKTIRVAVYTADVEAMRPGLAAHPQIQAVYESPSAYQPEPAADVVILDRFVPPALPKRPAIWIEPPDNAPFKTRERRASPAAVRWHADLEVCTGIRTRGLRLDSVQVFAPERQDVAFAEVDGGPIALLRPTQRMVALGFHPGRTEMRYDLATPLLLANLLRWMDPEAFRSAEIHGGTVGTVTTPLDRTADLKQVRVLAGSVELPYTVQPGSLRFFAGSPGVVHVLAGDREQVHSLSLPEVGDAVWDPPSNAREGIPRGFAEAISRDLWQILAIAGTAGLLGEWLLYGRKRVALSSKRAAASSSAQSGWRKAS